MPRDLPIGNGSLMVNFDANYVLRDIYYPRVGLENHTSGDPCRFGIWVAGGFSWLDDPRWSRTLVYLSNTLVTNVTLRHPDLQVTLTFNDAVDLGRNLLIRRVTVLNEGGDREIRLFFHFGWHIYGTEVGDTVMYYPAVNGLVAYKGQRFFAACGKVGDRVGLDGYACGKKDIGGAQGTWRDAEDGELGNNPIEQGSVDMTLALRLGTVAAGKTAMAYQWLVASRNLQDLQSVADVVVLRGPEAFLERTRNYWTAWVNKEEREFADLPPRCIAAACSFSVRKSTRAARCSRRTTRTSSSSRAIPTVICGRVMRRWRSTPWTRRDTSTCLDGFSNYLPAS